MVKSHYWTVGEILVFCDVKLLSVIREPTHQAIEECVLLRQEQSLFEEWAETEASSWDTIAGAIGNDKATQHFAIQRGKALRETITVIRRESEKVRQFLDENADTHNPRDIEDVSSSILQDVKRHVQWQGFEE